MSTKLTDFKQTVLLNALRSCQIFTGLAIEDLQNIAALTVVKSIDKGAYLFHEVKGRTLTLLCPAKLISLLRRNLGE
jgi:hypothetical protein